MYLIGSLFIVIFVVGADQMVKQWASQVLAERGSIQVIKGVFDLTYAENQGAAFSIMQGQRWLLIGITLLVVGILIYFLARNVFGGPLSRIAISFIIGGALGNLIDRIRFGYVVDMFEFKFINFAIFNVADAFLTVGAVMLILYVFITDRKMKKQERAAGKTSGKKEL